MYSFATQTLNMEGLRNARELGGYRLPDGRTVKHGLLLRGGALFEGSSTDIKRLSEEFHTALIFDLRGKFEVGNAKDKEVEGARYVHLPAYDDEAKSFCPDTLENYFKTGQFKGMNELVLAKASDPVMQEGGRRFYTDLFGSAFTQLQFASFFVQVLQAEPGRAIYWHCTQGKDRTGVTAAVMLAALGADRKLIEEDYNISNEAYINLVNDLSNKIIAQGGGEEELKVVRTFIGVNLEYFRAGLDLIDREFGSMDGYLREAVMLSDEDIAELRRRFTE